MESLAEPRGELVPCAPQVLDHEDSTIGTGPLRIASINDWI